MDSVQPGRVVSLDFDFSNFLFFYLLFINCFIYIYIYIFAIILSFANDRANAIIEFQKKEVNVKSSLTNKGGGSNMSKGELDKHEHRLYFF